MCAKKTSSKKESKILKNGKVVIVLQGRYAGRKAVILKAFDEGTKQRPYGHCIVAGIDSYPRKVTKSMSSSQIARRSKLSTFVKIINHTHLMPTRYGVDVNFAGFVSAKTFENATQKKEAKNKIRESLHKRYLAGKNAWFFSKLKF